MNEKIRTGYQIQDAQLLFRDKPTPIRLEDDYFFLKNKSLNLYLEDGHIFLLKPLFSFSKWPKISTPTGHTVDSEGLIWSQDKTCIFDQYFRPTFSH